MGEWENGRVGERESEGRLSDQIMDFPFIFLLLYFILKL
jgi:hypothetical protein